MFKRLERDLLSQMLVFIGYSLSDNNFRNILDDCRNELGGRTFPLSYAIKRRFTKVEEVYWREKYNIQLIEADADEFLNMLKDTWLSENRIVLSQEERRAKEYLEVDSTTRFQKVAESFYRIRPTDCTGSSNAKSFFAGAEASWADIRDGVPPHRDAFDTLYEALFSELVDPTLAPSLYLVTGAAGTGKTTLVHSIAYDIAKAFDITVLEHIPGTPLDARFLGPLVDETNPQRIIVIIRNAADHVKSLEQFLADAKLRSLPLTVILEERKNQWSVASESIRGRLVPAEFELGALSDTEINRILAGLEMYDALGKLKGEAHPLQVAHFASLAHKELLVALRELTSGTSFDEIIRDEFSKIPLERAKQAYKFVAAVGQIDLALRYEVLVRILDLRYDQLGTEIFRPTERVLISGEETGSSRHNAGFNLRTRHPIIASIIFDMAAPDDDSKLDILNALLSQIDPGFNEDRRLLEQIVRRKELVNTIASHEKRRAVYERLEAILPNDAYVLQHRSILERELDTPDLAIKYARKALELNGTEPSLLNTLGLALELAARTVSDPMKRMALLTEASKLFEDGVRRAPSDAYGYLGKLYVLRQKIKQESDQEHRDLLRIESLSLLEEAYEATDGSQIIAGLLAQQREQLGSTEEAITILKAGLKKAPADTRLRSLWIRFEMERNRNEEALQIALEGIKHDPTSWRLQLSIARLKRKLGEPAQSVKGYYEAAIRHHKDIALMVELGAYLLMNGFYPEARTSFSQAVDFPTTSYEKQQVRERWKDANGNDRVFSGKIKAIEGARGYAIAVPENFEAFFWRTNAKLADLRVGELVRFKVSFNALGPLAYIVF
jgi:hypothetical protein